jgi:hypothetical protein
VLKGRVTVSEELRRMWKETVMAYFKVLPQQFCRVTEESHENLSQDTSLQDLQNLKQVYKSLNLHIWFNCNGMI